MEAFRHRVSEWRIGIEGIRERYSRYIMEGVRKMCWGTWLKEV